MQCGTVELVRLMHEGYPNRCRFQEMLRFKELLPESFQRYGTRTFIEALLLAYDVPKEAHVCGRKPMKPQRSYGMPTRDR